MSNSFEDSIAPFILKNEGGYANNPNDPGGETNYGITRNVARANGYEGPMASMPQSEAIRIYKQQYWASPHFDAVAAESFQIGRKLFDIGVNMGTTVAAKFMQTALSAFNRRGADYPDLTVDGQLGPQSIAALRTFIRLRGAPGVQVLHRAIEAQQGERYLALCSANPKLEDFEYGWFANRLEGQYSNA